ncbi:hypothetical protein FHS90_001590 [Rufibacter quisquiliarum]|uniref:Uncharacterized protein n=1 Tax=Rufibacter quisquiliarum TaxID=1549639 RepID=A0A839GD99_9BACT|nr:hypothetical protein [Rufibacter quisquiliarum]
MVNKWIDELLLDILRIRQLLFIIVWLILLGLKYLVFTYMYSYN